MNIAVPSSLAYPLWNTANASDHDLRSCHGSALAQLGATLFRESCPLEAIEVFSEALSLKPASLSIRDWRAACYIDLGNYDMALADLNEIVAQAPKYATVYNNRGLCYLLMGRLAEALADLDTAIKLNPAYTMAYANRARIYCDLGQYGPAQQSCDMGLSLNPACEELRIVQRRILDRICSLEPDTGKQPEQ